jgi:hypothetical protein
MGKIKMMITCCFILCDSKCLFSQQLGGRITKKDSREILVGVTVKNIGTGSHNISDLGGNYRIRATPGDCIVFSSVAYYPDTLIIDSASLSHQYDIGLFPNVQILAAVAVDERRNFELDSIQRREDYRNLYEKKHPIKLWNEKRPGDEPGLSFSPLGFLSAREKSKRRLKQRLKEEEEQSYIDYRFHPARVAQITGLRGDSLSKFLNQYRPSYRYCRNASPQDILLYINDKLIAFRKG